MKLPHGDGPVSLRRIGCVPKPGVAAKAARLRNEGKPGGLLAELELLGDGQIPVVGGALEVVEQPAALADHDQKTTPGAVILLVGLKVLGQVIDTLGEQGDLHVGRTGILRVDLVVGDNFLLGLSFHTFVFRNEVRSVGRCNSRVKPFFPPLARRAHLALPPRREVVG